MFHRFRQWLKLISCSHVWHYYGGIYNEGRQLQQWHYCPRCNNWMLQKFNTQCYHHEKRFQYFLGGENS